MKLLSLDMSTRKTGWAIFDDNNLIAYNLIEIKGSNTIERTAFMSDKIQELITSYNVDCVACEDVPVSVHSNLEIGKNLCVLQGCLLEMSRSLGVKLHLMHPTYWRSSIGMHHTLYSCETCGNAFEDVSGLKFKQCDKCGEKKSSQLHKTQLNDRASLKERAVQMANNIFNLGLKYINKTSTKNQDDIAEAILVGYSFLKYGDGENV